MVEERLVNKMDDISDKLNVVQNKLASMDSNVAAAEARRRHALTQSSIKAVERVVNDKVDAVDRRLRQQHDRLEAFERNIESSLEEVELVVKQRAVKEDEEAVEAERRRRRKEEEEERRRKEEMQALRNVSSEVERALDRWRGDTKEIAEAFGAKMTEMTTKMTEMTTKMNEMTKDVGEWTKRALAEKERNTDDENQQTKDKVWPPKGSMADMRDWKGVRQRMIWRGSEGGEGAGPSGRNGGRSEGGGRGEDEAEEEKEEEEESGEEDVHQGDSFEWQNNGKNVFSRSTFDFTVGKITAKKSDREGK